MVKFGQTLHDRTRPALAAWAQQDVNSRLWPITHPPNCASHLPSLIQPLGTFTGNAKLAQNSAFKDAQKASCDLVVFTELFITGYPPEDLILKPSFQLAAMDAIKTLAKLRPKTAKHLCLIGTPWRENNKLYNAVALLAHGKVKQLIFKRDLPNYSVFDEKRVFDCRTAA